MRVTRLIFFLSLLPICILLTSCEKILTKDDIAKNYKEDTITQFVADRYVSSFYTQNSKLFGKHSIDDYKEQLLDDGKSVIYVAYFTKMNDDYLYKPIKEVNAFCNIKKGKLYITKRYSINFAGLKEDPVKQYLKTLNSNNIPKSINVVDIDAAMFGQYSTYNIPIDKRTIAIESAYRANQVNHTTVSKLYQMAIKNGAYGHYQCVNDNTLQWEINLLPIAYKSADPSNQLTTDSLYILITPIERQQLSPQGKA